MFDIHVQTRETCLSDFYKDAHGFRPGPGAYPKWITLAELEKEYDYLSDLTHRAVTREKEMELEAQIEWEVRLEKLQEGFGIDEATALRWMLQAEDYEHVHQQDMEHFFWGKGMGFEAIAEWTKKTMELLELPAWSEDWKVIKV